MRYLYTIYDKEGQKIFRGTYTECCAVAYLNGIETVSQAQAAGWQIKKEKGSQE